MILDDPAVALLDEPAQGSHPCLDALVAGESCLDLALDLDGDAGGRRALIEAHLRQELGDVPVQELLLGLLALL